MYRADGLKLKKKTKKNDVAAFRVTFFLWPMNAKRSADDLYSADLFGRSEAG